MTSTEAGTVIRPRVGGAVTPRNPGAFVYVLRDDSGYIARELGARLDAGPGAREAIRGEYAIFLDGLYAAFADAARPRGPLELHVYSADELEAQRQARLDPAYLVASLDPLCTVPGAFHLGLSRWYRPGGYELAGEGARPGFPAMAEQIARLRDLAAGRPVALVEDDMYTGETLIATAGHLREAGVDVRQLVVGIRICQQDLAFGGTAIGAAVRYQLDPARPVGEQIDLGDPRDYLIGLSGLVILMGESPQPRLGRAPYVLPFVQPSERASFPAESDWALSRAVLQLAAGFYERLSERLGRQVLLGHCDPEFAALARQYLRADPAQPMADFVAGVLADAEAIAARFFEPSRLAAPPQAR